MEKDTKQRIRPEVSNPIEIALELIGGKWKLIILFRVMEQTRRFNELQRLLPRITQGNNR